MARVLRWTLIVALTLGGVPAPAQDPPPSIESGATTLSVDHDPVSCMVANEYPRIDACLIPEPSVQAGRVYFHSAQGSEFYYVEMQLEAGCYVGTLPRPNLDAGPVTYYVEGLGRDFTQTQTSETAATVVEEEGDCRGKVAAVAPVGSPVQVYSLSGTTALPPGFSGVSSVLAAGAPTTAAAATGAGAGSFITSTGGLVLMGAAVAGIGIAIVAGGDDPPPESPSR